MRLSCKKIGINGEGIAYDHRIPVFVDGFLPEEEADIEIIEDHGTYRKGKIHHLYISSKQRVTPNCPYYKKCGGCSFMHVAYPAQLRYKKELVQEALHKYAKVDIADFEILENPQNLAYRNALKLPVGERNGRLVSGLYAPFSNRFLAIDRCMIHQPLLEQQRQAILEVLNRHHCRAYDRKTRKGIRGLSLRTLNQKTEACIITGRDGLKEACVCDLLNIEGLDVLDSSINSDFRSHEFYGPSLVHLSADTKMDICFSNLDVSLSTRSFFQLNTLQAERLYALALSFINNKKHKIVEAYCGVGLISLLFHDKAEQLIGIESIEEAVKDAQDNAQRNGIDNCHFLCGDAGKMLTKKEIAKDMDLLIVDPPRSGLDHKMIESIKQCNVPEILYISCNPVTLAKNIADLGYTVKKIACVDLFSQTSHVETVVLMSRKDK